MHILFVTATRIGDAVLSTGLLTYLIDRYPRARPTIAAGPVAAPLFAAVPRLERVLVIEKPRLFDLDPPPAPRLWTTPDHERLAAQLVPPGPAVLAIGPAANWRGKQWRAERFAELALRLTAAPGPLPGFCVAVLGAQHERSQAEPLLAAIPPYRRIDLVGRTELLTAVAVLRRCAMFIGNDTGL